MAVSAKQISTTIMNIIQDGGDYRIGITQLAAKHNITKQQVIVLFQKDMGISMQQAQDQADYAE